MGWQKIRAYIRNTKKRPCADCGQHVAGAMEFDHRDGETKLFNISDHRQTFAEVRHEVSKCDVVCCYCHSMREKVRGRHHGH